MHPVWKSMLLVGSYNREVQPVPGVSQVCELFQSEATGEEFDRGLVGVDCSEDHLGAGGVLGLGLDHHLHSSVLLLGTENSVKTLRVPDS